MAKQYKYEIFHNEQAVEDALNDGLYAGFKLIGIYPKQYRTSPEIDIIVWWEYEDTQE